MLSEFLLSRSCMPPNGRAFSCEKSYAVLGEATHFYTSYNTEGSTTRTLTSPSTPASNAQMAFAFVATRPVRRRRRGRRRDRRTAPGRGRRAAPASWSVRAPVAGVMLRNAMRPPPPNPPWWPCRHRPCPPTATATGWAIEKGSSPWARGHWEGDADEHLLAALRSGVRPSQSVRSSQHTLQFRPVRTRQRAAHGMCTGLDTCSF